jgi:inorganic pyrophosphatase
MVADERFWRNLAELLRTHRLVIDRPKGSRHPRFPELEYPLDYGYLEGTSAVDGNGVDVWVGSDPGRRLVGVICTVDSYKGDAELKLLVGCTPEEMQVVLQRQNSGPMAAILIPVMGA